MKIKTTQLKEMLTKAIKGVGNNKLIPITELIKIEVYNGLLTLETTDATNYLYITEDIDADDDIYAVVNADLFAKLIARTTSETVDISIQNNMPLLQVVGNGTYTLELPMDENGGMVKYPDPINTIADTASASYTIPLGTVDKILDVIRPALATTYENPCYTGYYFSADDVIATDTYKIACFSPNLTADVPISLMSSSLMELLGIMTKPVISVDEYGANSVYHTEDVQIYAPAMDGLQEFAVQEIKAISNQEFPYSCKISRQDILSVLDRLNLFISPFDKNAINLTFTEDALQIASKASSGIETLPYQDKANNVTGTFNCAVDIEMLESEIKAIPSDILYIEYGEDNAIKFIDDDVTIVVALLEE